MNLQQLRSAAEVAVQGLSITRAADRLNTSQPGVTRHLQLLEEELGTSLFVRQGKRIAGLTPAGQALIPIIERTLTGLDDLRRVAQEFSSGAEGELTVATVHTHARYLLPQAIRRFGQEFPRVRLRLRQGNRLQVATWVNHGEADFLISTAPAVAGPDLTYYPCYALHRVIVVPVGHPLDTGRPLTLEEVARYPIITYDREFAARDAIDHAFAERGLMANVVLSAIDADIMKTYVRTGFGIAILAHVTHDPVEDPDLRALNARHLFPSSMVHVGVRRGGVLGRHAAHLISLFAPQLSEIL